MATIGPSKHEAGGRRERAVANRAVMYRRSRLDKFFMGIQPSHFTMEEEKTSWLLLCRASHALKNQSVCFLVGSCGSIYLSGVTDGVGSGQGSERNKTWVGESSHQKNITRG